MLTGCHRGLSKVVSWCGDTTVVWTQPVAGIEILSCVGEGFFHHLSWHALQKSVTCITRNAASEIGGDASPDASPAAQIAGRLSI